MAQVPDSDPISVGMLHHHTRAFCREVRDLNCRLVVSDDGERLAALVPIEDLRRLEALAATVTPGVALDDLDETA